MLTLECSGQGEIVEIDNLCGSQKCEKRDLNHVSKPLGRAGSLGSENLHMTWIVSIREFYLSKTQSTTLNRAFNSARLRGSLPIYLGLEDVY